MQSLEQRLLEVCKSLPVFNTLWVAFSGGVDSQVLLHALNSLRPQLNIKSLAAVYINHQLHPDAGQWGQHCSDSCESMGIAFHSEAVSISNAAGESLEARAREARYRTFRELIKSGDCLMTAHHQDDQAETLLLQLLRGAGPHGLAAMPLCTAFAEGHHARPLLDTSRADILEYATQHHLDWIEDSSNSSEQFDRNYLRLQIMPLLKQRWPAYTRTFFRSASLCAEAAQMLDQQAQQVLQSVIGEHRNQIFISQLLALSEVECRNLLHYWLETLGLPLPSYAQMQQIIASVIHARHDAVPLVQWQGAEIRRYDDALYAMRPMAVHDHKQIIHWRVPQPLQINGVGHINVEKTDHDGIDVNVLTSTETTVRFRQGGERCQLSGHKHSHSLKHLFQQWRIPPWLRDRVPLIYANDELAAVAGYGICSGFAARDNASPGLGLKLIWQVNA